MPASLWFLRRHRCCFLSSVCVSCIFVQERSLHITSTFARFTILGSERLTTETTAFQYVVRSFRICCFISILVVTIGIYAAPLVCAQFK
ncbi:hypothetical protein OBBRIDRAFT_462578 [Obba rivulosa]|uniref:Uncharacterized protein n=1 Tax=Obba rivulosa TaxID=1052685 RepID=A0A8E2AXG3_9APHY|nr:hypothetical protein OBBRIDRAFT_462578 [Obba rivulosa]